MKALAIDSASSCMVIAARNGDNTVTCILDIGMRQSEKILPTIDYVLAQAELKPADLDYMVLCEGPGSFTGLRIAFAALKSIELATGVPVYGVPTLEAYARPYASFKGAVVPVIDAKKDQFFAAVYRNGKICSEAADTNPDKIIAALDKSEHVLSCGPDAKVFAEAINKKASEFDVSYYESEPCSAGTLFAIAEEIIAQKKPALRDFDGPVYLRKSEAELSLSAE